MTGVVVRLVLAGVALVAALYLLRRARAARAAWARDEAGITRAERWWADTQGGPFDQDRPEPPADVVAHLRARGPRTDLRRPRPAQAEWVWGWLLLGVSALLAISVAAQVTTGTV